MAVERPQRSQRARMVARSSRRSVNPGSARRARQRREALEVERPAAVARDTAEPLLPALTVAVEVPVLQTHQRALLALGSEGDLDLAGAGLSAGDVTLELLFACLKRALRLGAVLLEALLVAARLLFEGALLLRPAQAVAWQPLDAAGCAFLDACRRGLSLGEAATAALAAHAAADVAALLARLLQAGAFTTLPAPPLP